MLNRVTETPFAAEGREILALIRKKAPEDEIQPVIDAIHAKAAEAGIEDPLVPSTDAYMTSVCFIGSKSLSHVLSCIERCKERLLGVGAQSDAARLQIITSVVSYWRSQQGIAVNIIDKLLNYTIVTPASVVAWTLDQSQLGNGAPLSEDWRYEMLATTVNKVTNRVRQIVAARVQALKAGLATEQLAMLDDTLIKERDAMRGLFARIEELLVVYAEGAADAFIEGSDNIADGALQTIKDWAARWAATFRRRAAVEETVVGENAVLVALANAQSEMVRDEAKAEIERRLRAKEEEEEEAAKAAAERTADQNGHAENGENGHVEMKDLDVADDDIAEIA
jgi:nuclear cap-binding protein subunit 1